MKIILLGYMGSGKTTLAKALAAAKNIPFIDLDDYIAVQENMPIQEIFATKGEIYFRKKEAFYLQQLLAQKDNFILSLGGGTPCFGNNMALIQQAPNTLSVYLKYQPISLAQRLAKDIDRPLLKGVQKEDLEDFIRKHLFERTPFYRQATHTLTMDGLTQEESLHQLLMLMSTL